MSVYDRSNQTAGAFCAARGHWRTPSSARLRVGSLLEARYAGRLLVTKHEPIARILAHLGLPTEAPAVARARDPTDYLDDEEQPGQLELSLG
jgi:hypothetical protein